ncbi:MAG TPA: signal recognition particle-docking protein FtsY, partial [Rhodobacter sp.]|nr:signal recognition particle-docking protein FtsY [Rhodobacter sp.]HCB53575.1 signal recognition particle-docking protein FtsY [Rhodobacter sp.]HCK07140.1 signal recognition particle-docking protein FtsY [Rhodobacter sp.]
MAFFKKLADRLFRSSDRITEGLDAVIDAQAPGVTQSPQPN